MAISPLPADRGGPDAVTSTELARHVRFWRLRLDPAAVPGVHPGWSRSRRRRCLSQEQVAQLVGCTRQWFSLLELGYPRNYSDDFLATVAQVLRLNLDETRLLFLLAGKHAPAIATRGAFTSLEPILAALPWPAYLSDQAWDLVAYNEQMRALFPWVEQDGANVMQWVFTEPDARRRLHRWDTEWAPQMLAQMRAEQLLHPAHQRLNDVLRTILNVNTDAQRLWREPLAYFHPDGDLRSIYLLEEAEPYPIQVVALEPLRLPGHRLIMLVPAPVRPETVPTRWPELPRPDAGAPPR